MASKTGLGSCPLWGLTPAMNLLAFLDDETLMGADTGENAINILLLGQSDCRHIFRTLEEHLNLRMREIKINVYIIEPSMELYARQLLFLTLAATPLESMGLYEKTRQFLEFYGNTHLRPRSQHTLTKLANKLIKLVSDEDYLSRELPFVSISDLKFIERDALAELFKYWHDNCDVKKENLDDKWDKRLRIYLGTRYDSRVRIFDWDYHMRLCEQGISIISAAEYKTWRGSGMAFVEDDADYSQPNVTLLSPTGTSSLLTRKSSAFMGEIITGPFIAYGVECDEKSMFEKSNDRHRHSSLDVTVHNLEKIFKTLNKIEMQPSEMNAKSGNEEGGGGDGSQLKFNGANKRISDTISVTFLPMESAKFLYLKSQLHTKFHLVYFGNSMAQNLTPEMAHVFGPKCVVIVEGVRYILELRKEHINAYNEKVEELAKKVNLHKLSGDSENYGTDYLCYTVVPPAEKPITAEENLQSIFPVESKADSEVEVSDLVPNVETTNVEETDEDTTVQESLYNWTVEEGNQNSEASNVDVDSVAGIL